MAEEMHFLTREDLAAVREMLAAFRSQRWMTGQRPHVPDITDEGIAPEVYVAKAPPGGIPSLIGAWNDAGGGTGTGTNPNFYDQPGFAANVQVHRITSQKGDQYFDLQPILGLVVTVFNLSRAAVPGDAWILIARDKPGRWIVTDAFGEGGSGCANTVQVIESFSFDPDSCTITATLVTVCAP